VAQGHVKLGKQARRQVRCSEETLAGKQEKIGEVRPCKRSERRVTSPGRRREERRGHSGRRVGDEVRQAR
jgi:hypothetical protein